MSGMVAVFIASKFEDSDPISIRQIFLSAGHGKYQIDELKDKELDVLNTIKFKIHFKNIYQECGQLIQCAL